MADFTHTTRVTVTHEWHVPEGAPIAEFSKAYSAAAQAFKELTGAKPEFDDWARVYPTDDGVAIRFEVDRGSA